MRAADELWGLLEQARRMPYGSAQIALVEQLLPQVDAAGDPDLAFTTRLIATNAYVYGGEKVKSFVTFSWCLSDFDNNPGPHHQRRTHTLLWHFKYMVNALEQFPEIPLARTYAVLDDMERRYREAGHSMQVVHKHRYLVAKHLGLDDEADQWYSRWQAAPRDSISDCAGCDPTDMAAYLNSRGRYREVVELAEPVLAGELSCNEQPQGILRELTTAYLFTGDLEKAADAHRRAYRLERGNLADLWTIGTHIAFCARTGNEHRGLEMLQRHIDWLEKAPSPAAEMNFAADAAMLLRRLTELGHGDLTVRRQERGDIAVTKLATELAERATELAARFDARNGSGYQGRRIAERIAAEPYGIDLALSPTARPVVATTKPEPSPEPEVPDTAGPAELLDLAAAQYEQDRIEELTATLAALDARFPALDDPLLIARRAALAGNLLSWNEKGDPRPLWAEAIALLEAAGAEGEASVLRARAAITKTAPGEIDAEPIRADVDYQEKHGDAAARATAWARLSILHVMRQELAEAIRADDRAYDYANQTGDPWRIARHALQRARIRANADDSDAALDAARVAWNHYREHGPKFRLAEVAVFYGHLNEDAEERVEAFGVAISSGVPGEQLPARVGRGHALKQLDRPHEAVDDLVEAVALCAEQGFDAGGAFARYELAEAYAMAGRPFEAAEVAEEALRGFEDGGNEQEADNTRHLLAQQYRAIGDTAGAVARYRELIERLADNPGGRGRIGEEAAGLLYDLNRDAEAAAAFLAAARALHEAGDLIGELRVLRRRVGALHFADDPDAAVETARLADERFAALPADLADEPNAIWQNSLTAWGHARVLVARDRHAEAVPVLRDVAPRLRAIGAADDADQITGMYGEALLGAGEVAEAEAVMRNLLDVMAPDAPGRETAEKVYAEIREALGTS
ncbi:hypothetical protein [Paractinoplanes globisporus]|uniref:Tetratricopeptide repeat protein n=1 Tax=Paractinoplanes globisporus TaxID=113565 RepID=A0ABW6WSB8_9ACTN|nr:hypothetical protein [Actinoplanes globisporus]